MNKIDDLDLDLDIVYLVIQILHSNIDKTKYLGDPRSDDVRGLGPPIIINFKLENV